MRERVAQALRAAAAALKAKSFSEEDIPRDFRLMFFLPNQKVDVGAQLAAGVLEGVTGITDSGQVLMLRMLGQNRNAMLIMPGPEVVKLNHLSRVMYDNPEYLMSNDMAAIQRIYGGITDHEYAINRILQAADKVRPAPDWFGRLRSLDVYAADFGTTPINSVLDLAKKWRDTASAAVEKKVEENKKWLDEAEVQEMRNRYAEALDLKNLSTLVKAALTVIGKDFVWEGEWILKDKNLRIPNGSRLVLIRGKPQQEEAVKQYGLDKHYKILWADSKKLDQASMKLGMEAAQKLTNKKFKK
jgi:hypothetical protein